MARKIYTLGGKRGTYVGMGYVEEGKFDKRARELAKGKLSLDDATEKLMKEFNVEASHSKMRIHKYRR